MLICSARDLIPFDLYLLTEDNAREYLSEIGWPGAADCSVRSLGGGVSNTVLLAESPAGRVVCKQALERLRVEADWRSRPERTLREAEALGALSALLPPGTVPEVHFLDRDNCIYVMEAAPAGWEDWKTLLLRGDADPEVAATAGRILGSMIRSTWRQPSWEDRFGDQTVFDELRLDPYYRFAADRLPRFAHQFAELIESCRTRRVCLVHGDWSPKNLLTGPAGVMAIDFEVVHYGDPSFDTGFLLCHLLLKSVHLPRHAAQFHQCALAFWDELDLAGEIPWLLPATVAQLGGLLLARVEGKSPAEYLAPAEREEVRHLAQRIIGRPPLSMDAIWKCL